MTDHEHKFLPETQYRFRRCSECGAHHEDDALDRLRRRAHVHVGSASGADEQPWGSCYGMYETCGEHHVHDRHCGGRDLRCGQKEDRDAVALVALIDRLRKEAADSRTSLLKEVRSLVEQAARAHEGMVTQVNAHRQKADTLRQWADTFLPEV